MTSPNSDAIAVTLAHTDQTRNATLVELLNGQFKDKTPEELRTHLETIGGKTWTNEELINDFEVEQFSAPYAVVIRKSDGVRGTVMFIETPRLYFYFCPVTENDTRNEKTV